MKKQTVLLSLIFFIFSSMFLISTSGAQSRFLEDLSQDYFTRQDYEGFYNYLNGLLKEGRDKDAQVYFYFALTRQKEIQHWQETKDWEGVYDRAAAYRKEIAKNLKMAEDLMKDDPVLSLAVTYLKWQNVRDEDPTAAVRLFRDMLSAASAVSASEKSLRMLKSIADELSELEDKTMARRLYEIYVVKLSEADLSKEELKTTGTDSLNKGNVYLAKALFDVYLKKLSEDTGVLAAETVIIADKFAHSGWQEGVDPFYAEELYKEAYNLAGSAAFKIESQYLRAFNLERMRDYEYAFKEYKNLLNSYSQDKYRAEVYFRLGVLAAYAQKNIPLAEEYFLKVKDEFTESPLKIYSLYQTGLLSQWKKDFSKAEKFYTLCLLGSEGQGADFKVSKTALLAQERLQEIKENKDIKYPIKLFLEEVFKSEEDISPFGLSVDLTARPSKANLNKQVNFYVTTSNPQTGCMVPDYAYEWSGETGILSNIPNAPELTTKYNSEGIKVVQVVVVGPQGPEGAGFEMVEINDAYIHI